MNDNNLKYAEMREKSDKEKVEFWKNIDWKKAENFVNRLQIRIVKAKQLGKKNLIKRLQYLLVNSFYAKIIAIRKVTTNKGKKTAGIDGIIWETPKEKYNAIKALEIKGYKAKPTRRIHIKKANGKLRPLSIPTMTDRAMQTLYLLALQPIEETTADENSYGFRMYRSCHDAMEKIFSVLAGKKSAEWILEGDIRGCFDNISHEWIEKNIPIEKKILKQFIKAGYMYKKKMFPTTRGAIQGGAISPTIANMVLDGLEEEIHNRINVGKRVKVLVRREHKINYVRFADDFVVTGKSEKTLEQVKDVIQEFLMKRGLELSEEKTKITHIEEGFDFLGWSFKKYNQKLIIKPSEKSIKSITNKLSETIKQSKGVSQKNLIVRLNPIIAGWSNYHQPVCAKEIFASIDNRLFKMLIRWINRKHNNKNKAWKKRKYWSSAGNRNWIFTSEGKELRKFADIPIVRHRKIAKGKNPYLDKEYFITRKMIQKIKRQKAYKRTAVYELATINNNS